MHSPRTSQFTEVPKVATSVREVPLVASMKKTCYGVVIADSAGSLSPSPAKAGDQPEDSR